MNKSSANKINHTMLKFQKIQKGLILNSHLKKLNKILSFVIVIFLFDL